MFTKGEWIGSTVLNLIECMDKSILKNVRFSGEDCQLLHVCTYIYTCIHHEISNNLH